MTTMLLAGKRIIVTGGASGLGAATVEACSAEGAQVAVLDLDEPAARAVVARCGGSSVRYHRCDVTRADSVQAAFDAALAQLGGLDVLVHCAGIAPGASAETITLADWERVFAVNSRGTFLTNQAAFEPMKAGGGGRILNFASAAGTLGYAGKAHYAASKGAVLAWTRTIAREWGRHGITANAIAPAIATPMYARTRDGMTADQLATHDAAMAQTIPLGGRLGDPQRDLAPVMVFLAGDGARFITGQTLAIDGGAMMLS